MLDCLNTVPSQLFSLLRTSEGFDIPFVNFFIRNILVYRLKIQKVWLTSSLVILVETIICISLASYSVQNLNFEFLNVIRQSVT